MGIMSRVEGEREETAGKWTNYWLRCVKNEVKKNQCKGIERTFFDWVLKGKTLLEVIVEQNLPVPAPPPFLVAPRSVWDLSSS